MPDHGSMYIVTQYQLVDSASNKEMKRKGINSRLNPESWKPFIRQGMKQSNIGNTCQQLPGQF